MPAGCATFRTPSDTKGRDRHMAFMLKIRWDINKDKVEDFRINQKALCKVMLEHPGVITYHAEYPA
jgi:hypothetical protein